MIQNTSFSIFLIFPVSRLKIARSYLDTRVSHAMITDSKRRRVDE